MLWLIPLAALAALIYLALRHPVKDPSGLGDDLTGRW